MELTLDKINKSFGKKHVLKDIAFTARSGAAMGFLGRNGSGKTTTIRIIMDIFPADSGTVSIGGRPIREFDGKIGYLPEERGLYPKRLISEQMAYLGELRGMKARDARERGLKLLKRLGAEEYYSQRLDTLSKGNQQKIQLAIALINDPEIIILDEPFSGLDPVNARILKDVVGELVSEGRMVIFSSHQMGYVEEFCDDICLIDDGACVLGGNLRQIKKTYPRNRILLTPENDDFNDFKRRISASNDLQRIIQSMTATDKGFLIALKNAEDKVSLFNTVAQTGVAIDAFQVVEPTLEEIFVEKAGGEYEAV